MGAWLGHPSRQRLHSSPESSVGLPEASKRADETAPRIDRAGTRRRWPLATPGWTVNEIPSTPSWAHGAWPPRIRCMRRAKAAATRPEAELATSTRRTAAPKQAFVLFMNTTMPHCLQRPVPWRSNISIGRRRRRAGNEQHMRGRGEEALQSLLPAGRGRKGRDVTICIGS
jgi:hypothetical protein